MPLAVYDKQLLCWKSTFNCLEILAIDLATFCDFVVLEENSLSETKIHFI